MDDTEGKLGHLQRELDRLSGMLAREGDEKQQLARALKVTRWLAIAALLLGVLGPLAGRWLPMTFRTVRARELIVQDAEGRTRVQLIADKDSASIVVNDLEKSPAIAIKVDGTSNVLYVASRSPKPSTGIRLDSSKDFTSLTLQHQEPAPGKDNLSGWIQLQSTFQDDATLGVYAADGGRVMLEGSGLPEIGPRVGLYLGDRKDLPSSWLTMESYGGRPSLNLVEMGGTSAKVSLAPNGPQLALQGVDATANATLLVNPRDKGGSLMLNGDGKSVFATTGNVARVAVVNGLEDDQSWSTPLPKPKAAEKEKK